mmetsp:Transcript_25591/g.61538  ORF Transcript_25591/g.61538 Transcript_25591/m.61538 type:complete len:486 (+) Transcript_25591:208-1665(+)
MDLRSPVPFIETGYLRADAAEGQYKHRYRHAHSPKKKLYACTMNISSTGNRPCSGEVSDEVPSYDGCVILHSSFEGDHGNSQVVTQKVSLPIKKQDVRLGDKKKRRNNKFRRFVAHKQQQRARSLKNVPDVISSSEERKHLQCNLAHEYSGASEVKTEHQEYEELASSSSTCETKYKTKESSKSVTGSREPDNHECNGGLDIEMGQQECSDQPELDLEQQESEGSTSPSILCRTDLKANESPNSVADFQPLMLRPHDLKYNEPPALNGRVVKRQIFNFIRVESNSNPKGNFQQNRNNSGERQTKNLSWWDDDVNKHKTSTLKTDETMDWDDDSALNHVDGGNWSNSCNQEMIQKKLVTQIHGEENSPYEVSQLEPSASDELIDSDDDGSAYQNTPSDQCRHNIIGVIFEFYRKNVSHAVQANTQWNTDHSNSMDSIDDFTSSMTEEEKMSNLLDLFDVFLQDEDDKSLADGSESTPPQQCNTCFT